MAKSTSKPRDTTPYPSDNSIGDSNITMTEWLDAIGAKKRPPLSAEGTGPTDLRDVIARTMRSVAASADAGNYDKAARLLRELRATDEYLRQRGDREVRHPPAASSMTTDMDDDLYADALRHPGDRGVFNPGRIVIDRWLRDFLKDGPKPSRTVYRRGAAAGFPARELRNARQRIGALIHQKGYPCRTTWLLRGQHGGKP